MKYHIITFGCQMNISDSQRIAAILEQNKHKQALSLEKADLVIINMCSVRQSPVDRVYGLLPKIKKKKTILTGCITKKDRNKLEKQFDVILNIKDFPKYFSKDKNYLKIIPNHNHYSALIPIMTGCNNLCTYCVVPYTREPEVSRPAKDILNEIKQAIKQGVKEIWLLGQNVNSYKPIPFSKLLRKINNIPGNFWIRFTSSHPKDFSPDIIKAIKESDKATNYLNLPAQSGDNTILKKMNRPYTVEKYKQIIKSLRKEIPDITLSTDIIVGFPGETKQQFQNTVKLFKEIRYDMAYIAQYSPRPGTAAEKMKDNVKPQEKKRRWKILTDILKQTALENNKKYVNKEIEVLPEKYHNGSLIGKSKEYKTVKFKGPKNLVGKFVKVKIIEAMPWRLKGKKREALERPL